mgnify:CR=1 FL=1
MKSGKVRYIGASSMYAWQFVEIPAHQERLGKTKFVSMQNYYNSSIARRARDAAAIAAIKASASSRGARLRAASSPVRATANTEGTTRSNRMSAGCPRPGRRLRDSRRGNEIARERGVQIPRSPLAWVMAATGPHRPIVNATG